MKTTINNNMKAIQVKIANSSEPFSTGTLPQGSHYKFVMSLGRLLPSCRSQAQHFISNVNWMDVLNSVDVERIEKLLNKYNMTGVYKYTKSMRWVRLENLSDLKTAISFEYGL